MTNEIIKIEGINDSFINPGYMKHVAFNGIIRNQDMFPFEIIRELTLTHGLKYLRSPEAYKQRKLMTNLSLWLSSTMNISKDFFGNDEYYLKTLGIFKYLENIKGGKFIIEKKHIIEVIPNKYNKFWKIIIKYNLIKEQVISYLEQSEEINKLIPYKIGKKVKFIEIDEIIIFLKELFSKKDESQDLDEYINNWAKRLLNQENE